MRPAALLLIPLAACGETEVAVVQEPGAPPASLAEVAGAGAQAAPSPPSVVYAEVQRTPMATPARFTAALPASVAAFQGPWDAHPPRVMVQAQLCKGVPAMWEKLGVAVDAAAAAGDPSEEIHRLYSGLLAYCGDAASCAHAAGWVDNNDPASPRASIGWTRLAECQDDATTTRFRTDAAPDEALARFWFERAWDHEPEYVPALGAALQRIARGDDSWLARQAAVAHGGLDTVTVAADLLSAHNAATDPRVKDQIVAGMAKLTQPATLAIFEAHCAREDVHEALCPRDEGDEPWAGGEPDERSALELLADAELVRKVTEERDSPASWALHGALRELAETDWAAAREAAGPLMAAPLLEPSLAELVGNLERFESPQAIVDGLRELGLIDGTPPAGGWVSPADLLAEHGPVHWFDCETGMYPNQHDGLLAELAALAGPPMSGVAFAEYAPPLEGLEPVEGGEPVIDAIIAEDGSTWKADGPSSGYQLHAYTGTTRLTVAAEDLGDWYDLHAVLGLLNSTAREIEQDVRFVTLPTGDQTAIVLAAPPSAIERAVESGLIELAGAGAAEESGKAFEAKALELLLEQGL